MGKEVCQPKAEIHFQTRGICGEGSLRSPKQARNLTLCISQLNPTQAVGWRSEGGNGFSDEGR